MIHNQHTTAIYPITSNSFPIPHKEDADAAVDTGETTTTPTCSLRGRMGEDIDECMGHGLQWHNRSAAALPQTYSNAPFSPNLQSSTSFSLSYAWWTKSEPLRLLILEPVPFRTLTQSSALFPCSRPDGAYVVPVLPRSRLRPPSGNLSAKRPYRGTVANAAARFPLPCCLQYACCSQP